MEVLVFKKAALSNQSQLIDSHFTITMAVYDFSDGSDWLELNLCLYITFMITVTSFHIYFPSLSLMENDFQLTLIDFFKITLTKMYESLP